MEITKNQIIQVQSAMSTRCGSRDERLDFIAGFLDRKIKSTKDLSKIEADELLYFLNYGKTKNYDWGRFNKQNKQHRTLLSLMHQANWVVPNETHGEVADLDRLGNFLKSTKSPVNKPLLKMDFKEVSKVIIAFEGIAIHQNS